MVVEEAVDVLQRGELGGKISLGRSVSYLDLLLARASTSVSIPLSLP